MQKNHLIWSLAIISLMAYLGVFFQPTLWLTLEAFFFIGVIWFFILRTPQRLRSESYPFLKRVYVFSSYILLFVFVFALWNISGSNAETSGNTVTSGAKFLPETGGVLWRSISLLGIVVLVLVGYVWNRVFNKKPVNWKTVIWGVALQIFLALLILKTPHAKDFFDVVDGGVRRLLSFSEKGANFVFQTVEPHWTVTGFDPNAEPTLFVGKIAPAMKSFAFWILPTIVFFSSLMTVMYHLGIMQWVVKFFAMVMQKTMKTSGSETLSAAANIFVGQTEAPLVVKPFVKTMTRSELHAVMVGGFATVAGGVMAAYVSFLKDIPNIAGHLVTASIMSAPAALAISKVMYPETEESVTAGDLKMSIEKPDANVIEAASRGATEGMTLMLNVMAMLIAFVGLVALTDWVLARFGEAMGSWVKFSIAELIILCCGIYAWFYCRQFGTGKQKLAAVITLFILIVPLFFILKNGLAVRELNLARILGIIFSPFAIVMGVPFSTGEHLIVGRLLGEKLVLTEFIAYINLGKILNSAEPVLSERSAIIASYALCGFANFASIGIQIGGIGGIAPSRRADLARLGFSAMIGGSLAAFMTATIAGTLL